MGGFALNFGEKVKFFFHVLGFSCLFASVYFSLRTFYELFYYDYVVTMEPNKTILITEFTLLTYGLVYLMFLLAQYFYNGLREELHSEVRRSRN